MTGVVVSTDYTAGPEWGAKFKQSEAKSVIQEMLRAKLTGVKYHADNSSELAKELADDIKAEMKAKGWPRYKIVVHVVVGENRGAGIQLACRCLWDGQTDAYATETFESKTMFAVATIFGIYFY